MSADDNAPEQARDVEVVAAILRRWLPTPLWYDVPKIAARIVVTQSPLRAAERQEAGRAAWDEGFDAGWAGAQQIFTGSGDDDIPTNPYRADGATGRSGT